MEAYESATLSKFSAQLAALQENVSEIKNTLTRLSEAVTKLALIEERQTQATQAIDRAFITIERMEERLCSVEKDQNVGKSKQESASLWIDRGVVFLVTAALMFIARKSGLI